ncbi:MAG TPA: hypothetical protein PK595_01385 [Bacteroidota bacterium]|nr:hypothetical protein [Bacteroidota bacterium]
MKDIKLTQEALLQLYKELKPQIQQRLDEFQSVPPSDYFYELLYCLLTPQSQAAHAEIVVGKLKELDFARFPIDPEPILRNPEHYIRFHKRKSLYLLSAQQQQVELLALLETNQDASNARAELIHTFKGLGMKEATHFLRNIGRNDGLAILDRHILRMLFHLRVITDLPTTLSYKRYREIEFQFQNFSEEISIPLDELDLLMWYIETGRILK